MMHPKCQRCSEPSKHPVGFWDGMDENEDIIGGYLYDCENADCPEKKAREQKSAKEKNERRAVAIKNRENNIDIDLIREQSRKAGIVVYDMSKRLGLKPSEWCDQIYGRRAMEPAIAIRAMNEILIAKETFNAEDYYLKGWDAAIDGSINSLRNLKGE